MAYNFKSIADVEVVAEPAESANVLIEENGVIKKAPKTAVGGSSTEWDAIIEYVNTDNEESVELVFGNYQDVFHKIITQKEVPNIKLQIATQYGSFGYAVRRVDADVIVSSDDSNDHYIAIKKPATYVLGVSGYITWTSDNAVSL